MNKVRTLILCLFALMAFGALAASGASAAKFEPEWGQCVPVEEHEGRTEGQYGNPSCTARVKPYRHEYLGGFEWYPQKVTPLSQSGGLFNRTEEEPGVTTVTFANRDAVTCQTHDGSQLDITGPRTSGIAPELLFNRCSPDDEPSSPVNDCLMDDEAEQLIGTNREREEGAPTWNGTLTYLEAKKTAHPVVGFVWKTSPAKESFFEQINCEGGPFVSAVIGGDPEVENEAIVTKIEPVNTMSQAHTLSIGPLASKIKGTKPLEALLESKWAPVQIETTIHFPITEMGNEFEGEPPSLEIEGEVELKATP